MKKLLLGAMLAAACITTDVNAGVLGIRTASDKQAVDADLKRFAGEDYKDVSVKIINHVNDLKSKIVKLKKSKDEGIKAKLKTKIQTSDNKQKTAKSILDNVQNESKKISEFFKSMVNKNSRTKIAEKGNKAQEAANKLKASLTDLKNSESWESFKEELEPSITEIAVKLKNWANKAERGNVKKLDVQTLLTNLSEKFNDICKNVFGNDKVDTTVDQTSTENTVVQEEAPVVEKKVETTPQPVQTKPKRGR